MIPHIVRVDFRQHPEPGSVPRWRYICTCGHGSAWLTSSLAAELCARWHLQDTRQPIPA